MRALLTQSRWDALLGDWEAVCRHGPCGPWDRWILLTSMVSTGGFLIPLSC